MVLQAGLEKWQDSSRFHQFSPLDRVSCDRRAMLGKSFMKTKPDFG
jgi:hypothetical protein